MKKGIKGCLLLATMTQFVLADASALSVYRTGAEAEMTFRIVDDENKPVSNAVAHVWFCSDDFHQNDADWEEVTGADGLFTVAHKTNYKLVCRINKDGYYESKETIVFPKREDGKLNVIDGKWQPYGETRTVVLKKIKNPWAAKVHTDEQRHRKIPAFDQWLPFDMEVSDWLAPYGNGVHNDVLLRFNKAGSGRVGDFAFTMDACFTNNPYAGFYSKPLDTFSDLRTDYCAGTNADYCTDYRFMIDAIGKGRVKEMGLEKGSYLVFRTRTRVDENGKLVGAHYGKYCGGWRSDNTELHLGAGCFNPIENDTNIEGNQPLLYKIRNYKNKK